MEVFGILELVLPMGNDIPKQPEAVLRVENQKLSGHAPGDGTMRLRFCPKAAKVYNFTIRSNVSELDGKTGGITSFVPPPDVAQHPSLHLPNWWTDDPSWTGSAGRSRSVWRRSTSGPGSGNSRRRSAKRRGVKSSEGRKAKPRNGRKGRKA